MILAAQSKAFNKILKQQIMSNVTDNSLLFQFQFQSGFLAKLTITVVLLQITEDIRTSLEQKKCSILFLLDFSKAFDMILSAINFTNS